MMPQPTTIHYLGHSCVLLESGTHNILIDPFLTDNPASATTADKVKATFILVSHGHGDHITDALAIAKRTGATVVSNFEVVTWLQKHGLKHAHPMNHGGAHTFPFGKVELTLAHHSSALPDGSYGGNPAGFLIHLADGPRIYFAGDTALFADMQLIGEEGIDVALIPIGDNFTMGPDKAVRAIQFLKPTRVIPIHYNTWPVIAQDPHAWASQVRARTLAEPVVLAPGEKTTL
jgi:L-ascorbate metabolism protein UlaG (beta-lactamase superfamily)